MYECHECERILGPDAMLCRHRGTPTCPFTIKQIESQGTRIQGFTFIFLGAVFLCLLLFFPISPDIILNSSISGSIVRIIIMSALLLFGLFVIFIGISLAFSRRLMIYQPKDKVAYQTNFFLSYQYKTKIFEDTRRVDATVNPRKGEYPVSIVSLGSAHKTQTVLDYVQNKERKENPSEYDRSRNELQKIASQIVETTFLDLLGRGLIEVHASTCYTSQVKTLDKTSSFIMHLWYAGTPSAEKVEGRLERQILHIVKNWSEQKLWPDQPLAPSLRLILQTMTNDNKGSLAEQIVSRVLEDARTFDGSDLKTVNLFEDNSENLPFKHVDKAIIKIKEDNPTGYRVITQDTKDAFDDLGKSRASSLFSSGENFKFKYLRVGIVVAIILSFTLGRYFAGLSKVSSLKDYVESTPSKVDKIKNKVSGWIPGSSSDDLNQVAQGALDTLEKFMAEPEKNIREIIALGRSTDVTIRRAVTKFLANTESNAKLIVPALRNLLRDADATVRQYAIEGLGNFGGDAVSAVPDLIFLLENDPMTAPLAAQALGDIGLSDSHQVVGPLGNALASDNPLVRHFATNALKQIGTDEAIAIVEQALGGKKDNLSPGPAPPPMPDLGG